MTTRLRCKRDINGQPIVLQHEWANVRITFNPDDDRFYVETLTGNEWQTRAAFKGFRNASAIARALIRNS